MSNLNRHHTALELDKVLELLAAHTSCEDARLAALSLEPQTDFASAQALMNQTRDAHTLLARFGGPAFGGLINVNNALFRADAGSTLSLRELLNVAAVLHVIRTIVNWRSTNEGVQTVLDVYFNALVPNKFLEDSITTAIISEDEIADNASPTLADIRRKIKAQESKVRDQLGKYTHNSNYSKYLQDNIITMRNGRYVIPVKNEYRSEVAGLVHDTSSSGATIFIEPMPIVEANNQIKLLKNKEEDEIDRILAELSANVGSFANSIKSSYECAVELNLIFAKAQLAYAMRASVPKMNNEGIIELKRARHPLIDRNKVVPVDIRLGSDFDTIVITGPNTGGKTVSIKTIGLMSLMAMCGLMLPVDDGSRISVFDRVLADIGDEQSIEQNLSTFSAHMTNIVSILKECDERSLLLFDELGAGTDPTEGAALAISIIEYARQKGAIIAATTHYAELKVYATNEPRVQNASCEFDVETLRPTYHLLVGIPGKSNAFAISKRLGLGEDIIEDAKNRISTESASFEATIEKLEQTRMLLEKDRNEAAAKLRQAEENAKKSASLKAELEVRLEMADVKAKREAERIIADARAAADETFAELDEMRKHINDDEDAQRVNEARSALRRRLNEKQASLHPAASEETQDKKSARPVVPGDTVEIKSMGMRAEVVSVSPDRVLTLRAGIMNVTAKEDEVLLIEGQKAKTKKAAAAASASSQLRTAPVANEIDLRGMETLEGVIAAERYIDSAVMGKLKTVTIIHGKGTGALRAAIQQMLKRNKCVKSFRLGRYGEGETGVTVVELK